MELSKGEVIHLKKRILCFGDSLTWGDDPAQVGHRLAQRWPVTLQKALGSGYAVIEEGQCGRTIATDDPAEGEKNGLKYILPCLESHSPLDLLIVMLGTNDCKRKYGYALQDIAWEMERMLQKIWVHRHFQAEDRYDILLMAPPPINDGLHASWLGDVFEYDAGKRKSEALAEWYRPLADRYGCAFMNAGDYAASSPLDGIHMDDDNQRKLGEAVAEVVRGIFEAKKEDGHD